MAVLVYKNREARTPPPVLVENREKFRKIKGKSESAKPRHEHAVQNNSHIVNPNLTITI
jgi:hypothetical protein